VTGRSIRGGPPPSVADRTAGIAPDMWATWLLLSLGGVIAVALLVGLVVLGSPLLAVVIAAVAGAGLLGLAAMRRSGEYVERDERRSRERDRAEVIASQEPDRGAPAAAEGGEVPPNPGAPTRSEQAGAPG
jgi:hypothetical protein